MRTMLRPVTRNPPTMTVEAAAEYIGISRATAYAEARRYRHSGGTAGLPNIKIGGRVLVLTARLTELLGQESGNPVTGLVRGDVHDPVSGHCAAARSRSAACAGRRSLRRSERLRL